MGKSIYIMTAAILYQFEYNLEQTRTKKKNGCLKTMFPKMHWPNCSTQEEIYDLLHVENIYK